jgi:glycosyltransferase involved in cell wall biosynthesis
MTAMLKEDTPVKGKKRPVERVYDLSIVVPAYNEVDAIVPTIEQLDEMIKSAGLDAEIVVVDDGSTDGTYEKAAQTVARVIRKEENVGYGHSLKTGIVQSKSNFVAIIDADGTYPADKIPEMLEMCETADMIVGNRGAAMTGVPLVRKPAKWVLNKLANILAQRKIPDLNSGLRVFRRESIERFLGLMPDGFSFSTTSTLCMICSNLRVVYTPISYAKRVGHSKIRPTDFFRFMLLVVRIIVLFHPLRVFLPLGAVLFALGAAKGIYDIFQMNLSESAIFALLAALVVWSLGLIADMISRLHFK